LNVLRLPAHVSLKQPFVVNDFERFKKYFEEFTSHSEHQPLQLDGFEVWGNKEHGVVVVRVTASPRIRQLHAQLNTEQEREIGKTHANHDGDDYEFHLSVALGAFQAELLPQLENDTATWQTDEGTLSSRLAMFIYEESTRPDPLYGVREYGTYKILPLGQKNSHS
jgi:2'-5' RNA ligase